MSDQDGIDSEQDETVDPAWEAMLNLPATRGELLELAQIIQLGLLSQSTLGISLIDGTEEQQRDIGARTVEQAMQISKAMRRLINRWRHTP